MKTIRLLLTGLLLTAFISCKKENKTVAEDKMAFDSTKVAGFFTQYPDFKPFEPEINQLYRKHAYHYIWYDEDGRIDVAEALYNRVNQLTAEGVPAKVPYKGTLDELFSENKKAQPDRELLISAMYFFYTKKVFEGVDTKKSKALGWFLPRDKTSYVNYLDELLKDPALMNKDESENISQYYHLRKALQNYRAIQQKGGWEKIVFKGILKPGDTDPAVAEVRKRLAVTGELAADSGSSIFDDALSGGLKAYTERHNLKSNGTLTAEIVAHLNIPVEDRIRTIVVNMERCRWIDPDITEAKELVAVNIPSYRLQYLREGKPVLVSDVVVGEEMNKTVVFSGMMTYLVFSPYWNIPKSIVAKEIQPGMERDKNYLEKHNMEWNGRNIRQKPGKDNSLGLVKFMFPNSNNIYLHDTPAKSLFSKEDRALSHGCVRVQKARELAGLLLEGDKNWTAKKIDAAMNAGKESTYNLNRKIPVYIAYFTAWSDANGNVAFFPDVYKRDGKLAQMLYKE